MRMIRWVRSWSVSVGLVLALVAVCALGALNICPKCGYENDAGVSVCSHCQAAYTPPTGTKREEPPQTKPAEQPATGGVSAEYPVTAEAVRDDLERASKAYHGGKRALARLYVLNALAQAELVDPADRDERWGEPLAKKLAEIETEMKQDRVKCPICDGTGRKQVALTGLDGKDNVQSVAGQKCSRCGGDGALVRVRSLERLTMNMGGITREFERKQRALGREQEGRTWLPAGVPGRLTRRQKAEIRRANPPACSRCMGMGISACTSCDGTGYAECSGGCDNGWVVVEREGIGSSLRKPRKKCDGCLGKGLEPCLRCEGLGAKPCTSCQGTGMGVACTRCDGTGLSECRRCYGGGTYRDEPCTSCGGEGVTLCTSCQGCGKRVR